MKGYKGFDHNFCCQGKQYAENTVFEEENAELCRNGMHFCENPFDVLGYYGFVDDNGNINEFAEVEALGDVKKGENKCCTTKLKIGAKIGIARLVKAFVDFTLERCSDKKTNTGYRSAATNTGDYSAATNTGYRSAATNTGNYSAAIVSGVDSIAVATGFDSKAKGSLGCWLVLSEWKDDEEGNTHLSEVKAVKVDGETIKADTFYKLVDGTAVESE